MNDMVVAPAAVDAAGASVAGKVAGTARRMLELKTTKITRYVDRLPIEILRRNAAKQLAWVEEYNRTHPNKLTVEFESIPTSGKEEMLRYPIIKFGKPITIEAYDVPSEAFFQFKKLQEAAINRLLGETST